MSLTKILGSWPKGLASTRSRQVDVENDRDGVDDMGAFFGASPTTRKTKRSAPPPYQPPAPIPQVPALSNIEAPRNGAEAVPAYTVTNPHVDPPTLAQYLFKFGFIFPPFWLFGAFILFSTLNAPADWHPRGTPRPADISAEEAGHGESEEEKRWKEDRSEAVAQMRRVEVQWARRCLIAFIVFAVVVVAIVLGVWFGVKMKG